MKFKMKFKELKSILAVTDEYKIFLKDNILFCDHETIDEVSKENGLYDKKVIFIKASDEDTLCIYLR